MKHLILAAALALSALPAFGSPLTQGQPAKIMAVGDSITEGKFLTSGGYRKILQDMLKDAGYSVKFVGKEDNGDPANATGFSVGMTNPNHEGYGSFRIDQIMNGGGAEGHKAPRIEATLDAGQPDVILMMLGTNDLIQSRDLDGVLGRLDMLVGKIFAHSPHVKLVLAAPTPMAGPRGPLAAVFRSGVPPIVAKYKALGDDVTFADMYDALAVGDLGDGVHPKPIGYAKMANVWFAALTGLTPKPVVDPEATVAPASSAPAKPSDAAGGADPAPAQAAAGGKPGALSFSSACPDAAGGPFTLGFRFTTGAEDVTVTALGYLNDGASGDRATHQVGIYDHTTQQLVTPQVSVTTVGGDLTGTSPTFTYVALASPVKLKANTTYDIAATMVGTGFLKGARDVVLAPGIAANSAVACYAAGSTLAYPLHTISGNGAANVGPNFQTAQ